MSLNSSLCSSRAEIVCHSSLYPQYPRTCVTQRCSRCSLNSFWGNLSLTLRPAKFTTGLEKANTLRRDLRDQSPPRSESIRKGEFEDRISELGRNSDRSPGRRRSNRQENVVRRKEAVYCTLRSARLTAALHAGICSPALCRAPQTSYTQLHSTTGLYR